RRRRYPGDHRRHDRGPRSRGAVHAGLPGGEHDHERHHPGRPAGGVRQRGRPPGAGRLLRGGGDRPPAAPGASRRDRPGLHHGPHHIGIETFDDVAAQIAWSHHWIEAGGRLVRHSAPYRYVWPSELDLMAKITGFRLADRWAGWDQAPFTSDSPAQVAVFEKLT